MKLLVIGSGMMGSAAAYDMARQDHVDSVTLADSDRQRAKDVAARVNRHRRQQKSSSRRARRLERKEAARLMNGHDGALSAVPYRLNSVWPKPPSPPDATSRIWAATTPSSPELALAKQAEKKGVGLAPDCGLSPGMASILAENWCAASTAAPTRSSSTWAACPKTHASVSLSARVFRRRID